MVSPLRRVPFSNAGVPAQQKGTKRLCPTPRCLARARHARTKALLRGSPRWAIPGPARLNRRPAGFPTAQCLRSAIEVNGAPKSKAKRGGLKADLIFADTPQSSVGARLAGEPDAAAYLLYRVIVLRRQAWLPHGESVRLPIRSALRPPRFGCCFGF